MLITDQHPLNKSLMVAVLGVPNTGKSSLINKMLGFDLTIVTEKPQTTRNKFHCVVHIDRTELIFVDTPGIHSSSQELNRRMNGQVKEGLEGADINLMVFDLSRDILRQYQEFSRNFKGELKTTWVVFNKSDLVQDTKIMETALPKVFEQIKQLIPECERYFTLSALTDDNIHELTGALLDFAPGARHLYPDGEVSNKNERFFVGEYIRKEAFNVLKEEVPYEIAVLVEDFTDSKKDRDRMSHINASIIVNRPSQRGIVVGAKGANIKTIGTGARKKIETMTGGRVHLNLHVKVSPKWFNNNKILEEVGLPRTTDSKRVWRKR